MADMLTEACVIGHEGFGGFWVVFFGNRFLW